MFRFKTFGTIRNFLNVHIRKKCQSSVHFTKHVENLKRPLENLTVPFSSELTLELQKETAEFTQVFPEVVHELTKFKDLPQSQYGLKVAEKHFQKALNYNVPHGKKIRGLTIVLAYKDLMANKPISPEMMRQAHLLGWCVELLQSAILTADDVIDCSDIRRGQPCWYKMNDVKSIAVNDILMIENGCYLLLKRFFSHLPCYANLFELLHESALTTFIGQSMDFQMSNALDVTQFTMQKYKCLTDYKTSHFAFYTPIALSMILAGYNDESIFDALKKISNEIGYFYQTQNDFLDCFGNPNVLNKPGTDIQDGKCTWLAVNTMELGNDQQREIMKKCYGKNDENCIHYVHELYNDLDLTDVYNRHEEQTYLDIKQQIEQTLQSDRILRSVMINSLNRTFNRT